MYYEGWNILQSHSRDHGGKVTMNYYINAPTQEASMELQLKLFSLGWTWAGGSDSCKPQPSDTYGKELCIAVHDGDMYYGKIDYYQNKANGVHVQIMLSEVEQLIGKFIPVDISLASSGDYALYTNVTRDRFVAGCRNFTLEQALEHWNPKRRDPQRDIDRERTERAAFFHEVLMGILEKKFTEDQYIEYRTILFGLKHLFKWFTYSQEGIITELRESVAAVDRSL